jgi:hypothetical protein
MALFAAGVLLQLVFSWTAYRHDTFLQAHLYVSYGLLVFLVVQTLRKSSQAKTIAVAITVYGMAVASFALLQGLFPQRQTLLAACAAFRRMDLRSLRQP